MYEAYFTKRLLEALDLAEEAGSAEEQSIHLRASRYYRDLLASAEKRGTVRHPVKILATLHHAGPEPRMVKVSDLSTCGFRMEVDQPLRPGAIVGIQLDSLATIDAYVIWQEGDQAGCKFLTELHPALLDAALAVSPRTQ